MVEIMVFGLKKGGRYGVSTNGMSPLLVTYHHPKSPVSEAFRTLRTSLHFTSPGSQLRLLAVTSAGPEEGKSTVAANLAIALAQAGNRVLIVDSDLRKPVQHKLFQVPASPGVTNVLVDGLPVEKATVDLSIEGLSLLPSGPIPPNPSELLGSGPMENLLKECTTRFAYVLLDTPPVLSVADTMVVCSRLDGVILVVRAGVTRTDMVREAKEMIEQARGKIVGVVLNGVRYSSDEYRYYYYYSHHGETRDRNVQRGVGTIV
ncbi:MAG: CpsD/CapB family tyrosine-protein kinase [Bacillota bacterium]